MRKAGGSCRPEKARGSEASGSSAGPSMGCVRFAGHAPRLRALYCPSVCLSSLYLRDAFPKCRTSRFPEREGRLPSPAPPPDPRASVPPETPTPAFPKAIVQKAEDCSLTELRKRPTRGQRVLTRTSQRRATVPERKTAPCFISRPCSVFRGAAGVRFGKGPSLTHRGAKRATGLGDASNPRGVKGRKGGYMSLKPNCV